MRKNGFFDVGSPLVDESGVYEARIKKIAELTGEIYEQIYEQVISLYKGNKKGDLEVTRQYGVEIPKWQSEYEVLCMDAERCLRRLSKAYKIGVIANQLLGISERLENFGIRKYL